MCTNVTAPPTTPLDTALEAVRSTLVCTVISPAALAGPNVQPASVTVTAAPADSAVPVTAKTTDVFSCVLCRHHNPLHMFCYSHILDKSLPMCKLLVASKADLAARSKYRLRRPLQSALSLHPTHLLPCRVGKTPLTRAIDCRISCIKEKSAIETPVN